MPFSKAYGRLREMFRRVVLTLATGVPFVWLVVFASQVAGGERTSPSSPPVRLADVLVFVLEISLLVYYAVAIVRDRRLVDKRFWLVSLVFAAPIVEVAYLFRYVWGGKSTE